MNIPVKGEAFDATAFETAVRTVMQTGKRDYAAYIGGLQVASGKEMPLTSPIDDSIRFGTVQIPDEGTSDRAVDAAVRAFVGWSALEMPERIAKVRAVLDLIEGQRYRLAATVALSAGMTGPEALAEVDALIAVVSRALDAAGDAVGRPFGPWAVISSYCSPLASPMGYALTAVLAGSTVVAMPGRECPVPVYAVNDLCIKAGLPDGVLNVLVDTDGEARTDLANNEALAGVVVSGSGSAFEEMMFLMVDDELRFINELKGMNPIVVHRPADMRKAVADVLDSAFRYSGQGLYSTSKVIVTLADRDRFTDMLLEQVKALTVDDPLEEGAFCGPLISREAEGWFRTYAKRVAGHIVHGGQPVVSEFTGNGAYVTPLIVMGLDDEADEAYTDAGLPVLYVKAVSGIEEAAEELVYTECGLSMGVYSRDKEAVDRLKAESDALTVFVNESSRRLPPGIRARLGNFLG
jgi:1-pyrroline-5-carboxylate dehydrogenase